MNDIKNKRKKILANKLHRQLFLLVFLAALLPSLIITFCLYYLIFSVTASQLGIPEAIAYSIIPAAKKVTFIILSAAPVSILVILIIAYRITHSIVGPLDRIIREMDERISGERKGPIILREGDKLWPLVDRINKIFEKYGGLG